MEKKYDFRPFEALYDEWESAFRIGPEPGAFSFAIGGRPGPYGPADMAVSRATIGRLDLPAEEASRWAAAINAFQDPKTGWYRKRYTAHFREHTTAYAAAALALLGARPSYPVRACGRIAASRKAMERWLSFVPWSVIWPASHIVSGLPAVMHLTGQAADGFFSDLFDWLDARAERATGFWSRGIAQRLGLIPKLSKEELGGAFHFHYLYAARGRAWPYPEKVVDAALALQKPSGFWDGDHPYCIDLDGIYCMVRSSELAGGYRRDDAYAACARFLSGAAAVLNSREALLSRYLNSHRLPGALSAVAECARAFPGIVLTERPWIQTLDRACFI